MEWRKRAGFYILHVMRKAFAFFFAAVASTAAFAAVKPGENLVLNGAFEADQADFPPFWKSYEMKALKWMPSGGPDGLPRIVIATEMASDIRIKQHGLDLVPGGKYRISMQVRTKNFSGGSHTGIMLLNSGLWRCTAGVLSLPKDTNDEWKLVEEEFKCFGTDDGISIMVRVQNGHGELEVADVRLVAIDELALAKSGVSKIVACERRPRIVPVAPLLSNIAGDDRAVNFRFFGDIDGNDGDYEMVLAAEGAAKDVHCPLSRDGMRIALPRGATNGIMTVAVAKKATGEKITERKFRFNVAGSRVPCDRNAGMLDARPCLRRLNNFCTEVLAAELKGDATNHYEFCTSRDGWIYASLGLGSRIPRDRDAGARDVRPCLRIDGREVIDASTPRHETFRNISAGRHTLDVAGAAGDKVVVREIVEILNYCPGVNSAVKENPPYDWNFNERYVLPAVTTQLGGNVPRERHEEFQRRGFWWVDNVNLTGGPADIMIEKLSKTAGMVRPEFNGVACDEQNYADIASIDAYANGLWALDLAKRPSRVVYTWAYGGVPPPGASSLDFLSACANISGGTGKLLREIYTPTCETEEEEKQFVRKRVGEVFSAYRRLNPNAMGSLGIVFGNFNQVPILSISHHPEVDFKYALDLQLNYAASDPLFSGIGLTGYWGSYYADDEMHRWSFALMRHYVVEGNTNMLSSAYGFKYRPDHILNGDFRGTLAPWKSTGEVRTDSHATFAACSQNRWGGNGGVGDTFAVLVRGEGEATTLSQTAKGLQPGKTYCLQFATFDAKDVKANKVAPRRFGIDVKLSDGAEIDKSRSWVHVDKRIKGRYKQNNGVARINLHHIVFTAKAPTVEITLSNAAAAPGEELGVNYLSLNPFYD